MEQINKRLTDTQKDFLHDLSIHIDIPIYLYGSIHRLDYFPGKSDLDIVIFTDNESRTIQMLCNYLNIDKNEFRKCFYKLESTVVPGFKGTYKDNITDIEIAIYNNKHKTIVLDDNNRCGGLPIYITIILVIVKFFYYYLGIISKHIYKKVKIILMNPDMESRFIMLDS
jgi:hypothetical protein